MRGLRLSGLGLLALAAGAMAPPLVRADDAETRYADRVQPVLEEYCYGCHGLGTRKGSVALDEFANDGDAVRARELWHGVLRNLRAGIMPPPGKPRPSAEEIRQIEEWIKRDSFRADAADPDPGRVTLRRLNRVEYRNTIRDLMGIDFRTDEEFPADDSGYGFDNIGDVLTVSPLLLEKYIQAAETIVAKAVPMVAKSIPVQTVKGSEFRGDDQARGDRMSFYRPTQVEKTLQLAQDGTYRLRLDLEVDGTFDPVPGKCRVELLVDGETVAAQDYGWGDNVAHHIELSRSWTKGERRVAVKLTPLTEPDPKGIKLDLLIHGLTVEGPTEPDRWNRPKNWERFFTRDDPGTPEARREYARETLRRFASRAFRRPVDERTLDRLVRIAEATFAKPDSTAEQGIGQAMVAVLASPRFLFRVEGPEPGGDGRAHRPIDEYSLASRLSYFLWSTMPDEELIGLAASGHLRENLAAQVRRMVADPRSEALIQNFTGQWLEARDVEHFPVQARTILRQDGLPSRRDDEIFRLRRLMKTETEMVFSYVVKEDRSVLEFLDSDYTFANEDLAKHYGLPDVTGREFRRVSLPEGSPRGGLLTQAGVLMITSNPSRTSPVKRGQFILENFLGSPTPPPPPDIPALEEVRRGIRDREPTVREVMALHRSNALCASCHARMDPLGLALENFNALGMWRETERKQPIDASGTLLSGQSFKDVRELKKILAGDLRRDFYRCLTEKVLTYALGRGLGYSDVESVDQIVDRMEREGGRFSALLFGVIESSPFQKMRVASAATASATPIPPSDATTGADR